jgi:hypothetical protein
MGVTTRVITAPCSRPENKSLRSTNHSVSSSPGNEPGLPTQRSLAELSVVNNPANYMNSPTEHVLVRVP